MTDEEALRRVYGRPITNEQVRRFLDNLDPAAIAALHCYAEGYISVEEFEEEMFQYRLRKIKTARRCVVEAYPDAADMIARAYSGE